MEVHEMLRVNHPQVLHESFDGEVIAIHQATGAYYSIEHVGAVVWDLIESGCTMAEIVEAVRNRYEGHAQEIEAAIRHFVSELLTEELVVVAQHGQHPSRRVHRESAPGLSPFRGPVLNKYSDMTDMLLLDPIHDVEEAGWPVVKPAAE
jgi:Coenzyme PQQ synthesis protein D (PqqD)